MTVEQFDRRTMAAMEVALDRVCACWPHGGTHGLRKRIAQSIIRYAKTGNTSVDALTEAGQRAIAELARSRGKSAKLDRADVHSNLQDAA
jgi:hypothetical protein